MDKDTAIFQNRYLKMNNKMNVFLSLSLLLNPFLFFIFF